MAGLVGIAGAWGSAILSMSWADYSNDLRLLSLLKAPARATRNLHAREHTSRYTPHQGKRECARRLRLVGSGSEAAAP